MGSSSSTSARHRCARRSCGPTRPSPRSSTRAVLPDSPAPGLVEFDAAVMASAALELARAALAAGGPVDAVGIANQRGSAVVWDRATGEPIGPGLGWQDLRTVGRCLELRPTDFASHPTSGRDQDRVPPRRRRPAADPRPVCRHGRQLDRVDLVRRRAARHRRHQRRDHRAGRIAIAPCGPPRVLEALRIRARHAPPDRRLHRRARRCERPSRRATDRRARRRPAGIAHRSGLRATR